jgi:hypothetical protein
MAIEFWAALPKKLLPPVIIAGVLGHSLAILMTTYAHYIPGTQDEAARLMDNIITLFLSIEKPTTLIPKNRPPGFFSNKN